MNQTNKFLVTPRLESPTVETFSLPPIGGNLEEAPSRSGSGEEEGRGGAGRGGGGDLEEESEDKSHLNRMITRRKSLMPPETRSRR